MGTDGAHMAESGQNDAVTPHGTSSRYGSILTIGPRT